MSAGYVKIFVITFMYGKTEMSFESMEAFHTWKEREEESTYSMYVRDQRPYQPKAMEGDVHL